MNEGSFGESPFTLDIQTALNNIALIAVLDDSGRLIDASAKLLQLLGYSRQESIGSPYAKLLADPAAEGLFKEVRAATLQAKTWKGEIRYQSRSGFIIWVEASITISKDAASGLPRFVHVGFDVTERKAIEELLANSQLALNQSQKSLQNALLARDEFISICSHELKTPITSMKLQFQIAERQIARGEKDVFAEKATLRRIYLVNRQLDRMSHLIEEMLDVSRAESGRLRTEMLPVDLAALTREIFDRFSDQFVDAGISALFDCSEKPLLVQGDAYRLEQVLANLFTNAIKYAGGQPLKVSVSRDHSLIRLTVQDHGPGISPESIEKIFLRYERISPSRSISGLGLGLYISRKIVEVHQGKIHAQSAPGQGTTFIVELPEHAG